MPAFHRIESANGLVNGPGMIIDLPSGCITHTSSFAAIRVTARCTLLRRFARR